MIHLRLTSRNVISRAGDALAAQYRPHIRAELVHTVAEPAHPVARVAMVVGIPGSMRLVMADYVGNVHPIFLTEPGTQMHRLGAHLPPIAFVG